jgi:hypothetical protein
VIHENPAGEWPEARGHYEDPTSNYHRRGGARHRRHAGGHEQRLQEQPTCVVRSDVHSAAPHNIARENLTRVLNDWQRHKALSRLSGYYCVEDKTQLEHQAQL